jgi:hypothetical protein
MMSEGKPGFVPVGAEKVGEAGPGHPRIGTPSLRSPYRCFTPCGCPWSFYFGHTAATARAAEEMLMAPDLFFKHLRNRGS